VINAFFKSLHDLFCNRNEIHERVAGTLILGCEH
jgi:hypothetical protein